MASSTPPLTDEEFGRSCTRSSAADVRAQPHQLGIDEAGRGPVLGPMVYAYAACPIQSSDALSDLGFADSKTLNPTQRSSLLTSLLSSPLMSAHFISLSPALISASMQSVPRTSLNVLSHDAAIALIHHALSTLRLHVTHVYVDTVGDPRAYHSRLQATFPSLNFTVTPKADSLYPIVSAASIVAKVTRDRQLEQWTPYEDTPAPPPALPTDAEVEDLTSDADTAMEGEDEKVQVCSPRKGGKGRGKRRRTAAVRSEEERGGRAALGRAMGSGYPGDPVTKAWLVGAMDGVFGWSSVVRFSWQTARVLLKERGYGVLWWDEVDEERAEEDAVKHTQRMEAFLVKKEGGKASDARTAADVSVQKAAIPLRARATYFQQQHLHLMTSV